MRIAILCGPPCAGKTTLAYQVAQPGDVVLDYDEVARELASPVQWQHPEPWRTRAERELQHRLGLALHHPGRGTAWLIRTAPRPAHRESLSRMWSASVYLLDPGEQECRRRAKAGGRPSGTARSVGEWYHRYTPWHGDQSPTLLDPTWQGIKVEDRGMVITDLGSV